MPTRSPYSAGVEAAGGCGGRGVSTASNPSTSTAGAMWPQTSLDEVVAAQALADADDPDYAWQVDHQLSSEEWWGYLRDPGAEIIDRFIREELAWDGYLFNPYQGDDGDGAADGILRGLVYLLGAVRVRRILCTRSLPRGIRRHPAPTGVHRRSTSSPTRRFISTSLSSTGAALTGSGW